MRNISKLSILSLLITSCVTSITNNVDKIENKIDSKVNAEAKVNTTIDTNVNANLKTGEISLKTPETTIKKDLDRFSEIRYVKKDSYTNFNEQQSRLFDDYKKIDSIDFNKFGLKGNLNTYIEIVYDDNGIKKSNNLYFEYESTTPTSKGLSVNSNGDFETFAYGGGNLIVKDIKNNISKKIFITSYDKDLVAKKPSIISSIVPVPTLTPIATSVPNTPIPTSIPTQSPNISIVKPRITGKVFDRNDTNVYLATVNLKLNGIIISTYETDNKGSGYFEFNNLVVGNKYLIEVLKQGYTSQKTEIITQNEGQNYLINFKGDLAIQDEPEIIETKINGKIATFSGGNDNPPTQTTVVTLPDLLGNELKIELIFSESIQNSTFEESFKIKGLKVSDNKPFMLDRNLSGLSFLYSTDNKKCTITIPISFLRNFLGSNQKIICRLESIIKDNDSRLSISEKVFNFGNSKAGYTTFSFLTGN